MDNFTYLFIVKIVLMFEKTKNKWKRGKQWSNEKNLIAQTDGPVKDGKISMYNFRQFMG